MNWKSVCGWLFVCLFVILTMFGMRTAVAFWSSLAVTGLIACLYHWWGKEALRSLREKPAPAPPRPQPRVRRSSHRRTSARTTRQSPTPHLRRAHPHTYLTGPRDDPKKIIRWLGPIHVGGSPLTDRFQLERVGTGSRWIGAHCWHIYRWLRCKIRDKHCWKQTGNIGWVDYETGRRTGTFVCRICGKKECRR